MWTLILTIVGVVAIAVAMAMALASPTRDDAKRARPAVPAQAGKWEQAGSDRRNAR